MTSVDSGVETGNDSNDSSVTHDSQSASLDVNSPPTKGSVNYSSSVSSSIFSSAFSRPVTSTVTVRAMPSSSSTFDTDTNVRDTKNDVTEEMSLSFRLPLLKPETRNDIEPPACLSYVNLVSTMGPGQGYEVKSSSLPFGIFTKYESAECKSRMYRYRLHKSARDTMAQLKGPLGEKKLRRAVSTNNVEEVQNLLSQRVNPNSKDFHQRSPLHLAACRGYSEIVRLLLSKGANPNEKDLLGNTPLHLAACTNHVEVVTLLLKAGTNVNSNDYYGRSPLQLAQSKLRLLQQGTSADSIEIKNEVRKVIDMMLAYLQKQGKDSEAELLNEFSSRLTLSQSKEEVDLGLKDLLASLTNLTIVNNTS